MRSGHKIRAEEYGKLKDELFWCAASDACAGVFEFIECIFRGGIAMAVATSASAGRTRFILEGLGLLTHFTTIVTRDEVQEGKPDPGIYRLACQRISCPPEAAVAVEDAASGIRAAKGAGLKCVGIAGYQSEEKLTAAGADYVLRDFLNLSLQEFHSIVGMQPPVHSSDLEPESFTGFRLMSRCLSSMRALRKRSHRV